jgi:hypothetical protein
MEIICLVNFSAGSDAVARKRNSVGEVPIRQADLAITGTVIEMAESRNRC